MAFRNADSVGVTAATAAAMPHTMAVSRPVRKRETQHARRRGKIGLLSSTRVRASPLRVCSAIARRACLCCAFHPCIASFAFTGDGSEGVTSWRGSSTRNVKSRATSD